MKEYCCFDEALNYFDAIYYEKTGNFFEVRPYQEHPHKFYHFEGDDEISVDNISFCASKLNGEAVFDLMQMLVDADDLKTMMCQCLPDLKHMPLGLISNGQIKKAMTILQSISQLIQQQQGSVDDFRKASNKFYTLIPHGFGADTICQIGRKLPILMQVFEPKLRCLKVC